MSISTGIVPFKLHHFFLIAELQKSEQAICPVEALTSPRSALGRALASFLALEDGQTLTFVFNQARRDGQADRGFVQVFQPDGQSGAYLLGLSPRLDQAEDVQTVWYRLLNHLTAIAAERGLSQLFASAGEGSVELEALLGAGFSAYAREDILKLAPDAYPQAVASPDVRSEQTTDRWDIDQLYRAVTPHLVQQAELVGQLQEDAGGRWPMARNQGEGFVLLDGQGIAGYGHLAPGQSGHWLMLMIHPRAYELADRLVDYGLALLNYYPPHPVYCAVRHYQGGVRVHLEACGFQSFSTQCCLVKHTAVRVTEPARGLVTALENRVKAPTTTVSPSETVTGIYER
ncbi:MAG: hypothetical protein JW934_21720 [Anaerolineae bacterium]|nr:hypothetical protein [Anaerolineae bacterium]